MKHYYLFHILKPSTWPLVVSILLLLFLFSFLAFLYTSSIELTVAHGRSITATDYAIYALYKSSLSNNIELFGNFNILDLLEKIESKFESKDEIKTSFYDNVIFTPGKRCIYLLILLVITLAAWFRDITIEGVYNRYHTDKVSKSLRLGALLFIVSEIMLFAGFFWAWFHSSLAPSHIIGCVWPPYDLKPLDPYKIPLLNTALLLTSGATITATHHAFLSNFPKWFVMITFIAKLY